MVPPNGMINSQCGLFAGGDCHVLFVICCSQAYISYVISAAGEWATGIFLLLFILLFHSDFTQLRVSVVVTPRQLDNGDALSESSPLLQ